MRTNSKFFYSIVLVACLSCSSGDGEKNRFEGYLGHVFNVPLGDGLYIIIPKDACKTCKEVVFNFLWHFENTGDISLIFIGEVEEALYKNYLSRIEIMGVNVLKDFEQKIEEYGIIQTEFPIEYIRFIDIDNGKLKIASNLTTQDFASDRSLVIYFGNHLKQ